MKTKFKKKITLKIINKQLHKNYSYKSLLLFYFLFNFDFFLLKSNYNITKFKDKLYNFYTIWKTKKINILAISKNKLKIQKLFLFFCLTLFKPLIQKLFSSHCSFLIKSFDERDEDEKDIDWDNSESVQRYFDNKRIKFFPFKYGDKLMLIRKIILNAKFSRKISILYNYFDVNLTLLCSLILSGPLDLLNVPKKIKEYSITDVFYSFSYSLNQHRYFVKCHNYTKTFLNRYYKNFYITIYYFGIYVNLICLKNKANYKIKFSLIKKKLLNNKLKKKKLIYFLLYTKKNFNSFYYNISINILKKKKNKLTFIRSPFIYKKSREQFIKSYVMYLFKIEKLNLKNVYKIIKKLDLVFSKNIAGSFLKYYFNIKYIKN